MDTPSRDTAESGAERRYWSDRQGRSRNFTPEQVRRAFIAIARESRRLGWFDEWFGKDCVDGWEVGRLGGDIDHTLLMELGREHLWPVDVTCNEWDDDTLFDVIEFLHDHVSSGNPLTAEDHAFMDCGYHYTEFAVEPARTEYRDTVNAFLRRTMPGYLLTSQGHVVRTAPTGLEPLLTTAPKRLSADGRAHVETAIEKYRSRGATQTDRRDAVRDLADVLEHMRSEIKETMPTKDEAMLFEIANKFWIRHNKPGENREYDHDAWWAWLFYVYLSSIALVSHIAERQGTEPTT